VGTGEFLWCGAAWPVAPPRAAHSARGLCADAANAAHRVTGTRAQTPGSAQRVNSDHCRLTFLLPRELKAPPSRRSAHRSHRLIGHASQAKGKQSTRVKMLDSFPEAAASTQQACIELKPAGRPAARLNSSLPPLVLVLDEVTSRQRGVPISLSPSAGACPRQQECKAIYYAWLKRPSMHVRSMNTYAQAALPGPGRRRTWPRQRAWAEDGMAPARRIPCHAYC
jgi:hypothetical protein